MRFLRILEFAERINLMESSSEVDSKLFGEESSRTSMDGRISTREKHQFCSTLFPLVYKYNFIGQELWKTQSVNV
jgi:hypothetical protein